MTRDKRKAQAPIPDGLNALLTPPQRLSLHQLESFGWRIAFVRRPLFQDPVVVLCNSGGDQFGVLEPGGELNLQADLKIRQPLAA